MKENNTQKTVNIPLNDVVLSEMSRDVIIAQIELRKDMKKDMVGWLYTSILEDEINRLYDALRKK